MSDPQRTHFLQSVARLKQIKHGLAKADKKERVARRRLEKSDRATEINLLELKSDFLQAKVELYNEALKIENNLIYEGVQHLLKEGVQPLKQAEKKEIVRLAKQLHLSTVLHKQRRLQMRMRASDGRLACFCKDNCTASCSNCTTSCTQCIISTRCTAQSMPIG